MNRDEVRREALSAVLRKRGIEWSPSPAPPLGLPIPHIDAVLDDGRLAPPPSPLPTHTHPTLAPPLFPPPPSTLKTPSSQRPPPSDRHEWSRAASPPTSSPPPSQPWEFLTQTPERRTTARPRSRKQHSQLLATVRKNNQMQSAMVEAVNEQTPLWIGHESRGRPKGITGIPRGPHGACGGWSGGPWPSFWILHAAPPPWCCPDCDVECDSPALWQLHLLGSVHRVDESAVSPVFKCRFCSKIHADISSLKKHELKSHFKPWRCSHMSVSSLTACGAQFFSWADLVHHQQVSHTYPML